MAIRERENPNDKFKIPYQYISNINKYKFYTFNNRSFFTIRGKKKKKKTEIKHTPIWLITTPKTQHKHTDQTWWPPKACNGIRSFTFCQISLHGSQECTPAVWLTEWSRRPPLSSASYTSQPFHQPCFACDSFEVRKCTLSFFRTRRKERFNLTISFLYRANRSMAGISLFDSFWAQCLQASKSLSPTEHKGR